MTAPRNSHSPQRPLFTRRALWFIFGLGGAMLALTVVLLWSADDVVEVSSIDTDSFSESAIGHKALVEMLEEQGFDVERGRYRSHEQVWRGDLLVLAEPHLMAGDRGNTELLKKYRHMIAANSGATMLVLPKRDGVRHDTRPNWLGASFMMHASDITYVLLATGMKQVGVSRTGRSAASISWLSSLPEVSTLQVATSKVQDVQLILPGEGIEPLITSPYGILFARVESDLRDEPIYVLSDPDLIATHGLHRGENAVLVEALVREALPSRGGEVIFDEVIHGHEQIPPFEKRLFRFPLLPMTLQVGLLLVFLFWKLLCRFGPPLGSGRREREAGKTFMIEHTAMLLEDGGHLGYTTERYIWMVLQDTARQLNAPARMSQDEMVSWLEKMARTRGLHSELRRIVTRTHNISDGLEVATRARALELARRVDRFRKDMTHES